MLVAFLGAVSVLLIVLGATRTRIPLGDVIEDDRLMDRLDRRMKRAGVVGITPSALLFAAVCIMVTVFAVMFLAFRNVALASFVTAILPLLMVLDLDRRARHYQAKLAGCLVPFLRRIAAQVRTGQNPTKAFAVAATEDKLLSYALREQLADLQLNAPFDEVLRDTMNSIPLRPWVQFVRSMDRSAKSGGELAEILESNVERIQSHVVLRKRLMGDVGTYRAQQLVVVGFAALIPVAMFLMGPGMFQTTFTDPRGWISVGLAVAIDIFAIWMTNQAIRDVESRMEA